MPVSSMGIEVITEPFLIPVWFYSYSAIVYAASAFISFLVAFFSWKFFKLSKSRSSMLFMLSFLSLTIAFSSLTFTSLYTYLYKPYFKSSFDLGSLSFINSIGFTLHYMASTIAYFFILTIYLPADAKKFFRGMPVLYLPLWYLDFMQFHIASILLLAYPVVKNIFNFYKKRNTDNALVMFAFLAIISSHACMMFATFDAIIYLAANSLLAVGFAALMTMLVRVSGDDRKKK